MMSNRYFSGLLLSFVFLFLFLFSLPFSFGSPLSANSPAKSVGAEVRPAETKPTETKPTETKPAETKPAETKPTETKQKSTPFWEHPEWKEWLTRYASSSPWLAKKKTYPSHFLMDEQLLDHVRRGNSKIKMEPPLFRGKEKVSTYDLFSSSEARNFENFDQIDFALTATESSSEKKTAKTGRNRFMRENMIKMITSRSASELNIFFVGAGHALDLFFGYFLKPDRSRADPERKIYDEVIYVGRPFSEATAFFTQEYREFIEASKGVRLEEDQVQNHSLFISASFHARHWFYNNLKRNLVKKDDLTKERAIILGNLIIMDVHYLRSKEPFSTMPSAQALKAVGINTLKLGLEGFKFGEKYQISDLDRLYRIKHTSDYSTDDLNYFKRFRPKAYQMYQKNFVTNVGLQELHSRLKDYEKNGIKIELTGLEADSQF